MHNVHHRHAHHPARIFHAQNPCGGGVGEEESLAVMNSYRVRGHLDQATVALFALPQRFLGPFEGEKMP
jgi:hypothetical protein